jgi:tetratricopeptide (TPR) repeat protein
MLRFVATVLLVLPLAGFAIAQQPSADQDSAPAQKTSRSDQQKERDRDAEAGDSSSHETRIDLSPPKDDAKNHPGAGSDAAQPSGDSSSDVQEMHPWNPYRAAKDDEVGDYYFKLKNYQAALARYQDALVYKENDAVANFRMAQCFEKLNQPEEAITHYKEYLKILPEGPFAKDARKALEKLGAAQKRETSQTALPKQ